MSKREATYNYENLRRALAEKDAESSARLALMDDAQHRCAEAQAERDQLREECERLKHDWEQVCMQHSGCLMAAKGWEGTNPPKVGDRAWSVSVQSVEDLRQERDSLLTLAREMQDDAKRIGCSDCKDGVLLADSLLFDLDREDETQECPRCKIRFALIQRASALLGETSPEVKLP